MSTAMMDAVLQQALKSHQSGNLPEAEKLYRQVLSARPDFAEVHVSLGVVLLFLGKPDEAASSCRRGVELKPGYAKGYGNLGNILAFQARFDEAAIAYRQALVLQPDYADAHHNLGNVLLRLGQIDEAALSYGRALKLQPGIAEAHNNLGLIYLQKNDLEQARAAFVRALAIAPDYPEANSNLAQTFLQLVEKDEVAAPGNPDLASNRKSRLEEAVRLLQRAIAAKPAYADAHNNLAVAFGKLDRLEDAVASGRRAIAARPEYAAGHNNLGNILQKQGKLAEAAASYRLALALRPDFRDTRKNLGTILCETGDLDESFCVFAALAEATYGPAAIVSDGPIVAHKTQHDSEQRAWLGSQAAPYVIGDGSRIPGQAINPDNETAEISVRWQRSRPQVVVIDNLLTAEALDKLRRYCLDSTVWRTIYGDGYLGAFPEFGFVPPLLAQIVEEMRGVYSAIIEDYPLLHFWAFKYDSALRGTRKHADFAAVNVNFWITPDDANLDPEHGGLVVWDAAAPLDWDFSRYNSAEADIKAFLTRQNAQSITVPYRANRAVIFDSDLFHETDTIRFKPGYENRRINITLLFGRRQAQRRPTGR